MKEQIAKEFNTIKMEGWLPFFEASATKHNIDLHVLLALASRETNCNPDYAYCRKLGDHGFGHGIVQIDKRYHKEFLQQHDFKPQPAACIDYGTNELRKNLAYFKGDYLKALCAYNAGCGGVSRAIKAGKTPDQATKGGNYGSDVLRRANLFKELLEERK